jgi:hypothetical protein
MMESSGETAGDRGPSFAATSAAGVTAPLLEVSFAGIAAGTETRRSAVGSLLDEAKGLRSLTLL